MGYITKLYREKIDEYYLNKTVNVSREEIDNIKKLYNRNLTSGFLFNDNIMNIKSSNHIGVNLGKVLKIDNNKISIMLYDDLNQEDGIRFDNDKGMIVNRLYNEKSLLVNSIKKGSIAVVDNKIGLKKATTVRKTLDIKLINEINKYKERKVLISFYLKAKIGQRLEITISDFLNSFTLYGNIVERAKTSSISEDRIKLQLEKLGDTVFSSIDTKIDMDENIFISIKEINDLRRELCDKLKEKREYNSKCEKIINNVDFENKDISKKNKQLILSILVRNEEQLKTALDENINYIYTDNYSLYKKYKSNNVYLRLDRVTSLKDDYNNENILVTELGGINKYTQNNCVNTDYFLNVVNHLSIDFFLKNKVNRICLSPETRDESIKELSKYDNVDLLVYGRVELMITKYCPVNMIINNNNKNCNLCNINKYFLKDKDDNTYPLIHKNHITHILDSKNINLIDNLEKYIDNGINSFRIDLYDENKTEVKNIINKIRNFYE